jgi:hypothetical protein
MSQQNPSAWACICLWSCVLGSQSQTIDDS